MPRVHDVVCVCGSNVRQKNMPRHLASRTHINYIASHNIQQPQLQYVEQPQPQYPVEQYQYPVQQPQYPLQQNVAVANLLDEDDAINRLRIRDAHFANLI